MVNISSLLFKILFFSIIARVGVDSYDKYFSAIVLVVSWIVTYRCFAKIRVGSYLSTTHIFVLMLLIFFSLINLYRLDIQKIFYLGITISSIFVGKVMSDGFEGDTVKLAFLFYFSSIGVILLYIAIAGYGIFSFSESSAAESRNRLSALLIFSQIFISHSLYSKNYKLPIIFPFVTFIFSLVLYGRSGIICAALILLFSFIFYMRKKKLLFIVLIALIVLFGICGYDYIYLLFEQNTNFASGLESSRADMIELYIGSLDLIQFLFGRDLMSIDLIKFYDGNPHNSLIFGHSLMGIPYIILLVYFIVYLIVIRAWIGVFFVLVFIMRAFADTVALPGIYDSIFFYIYFSSIKKMRKNCNEYTRHQPLRRLATSRHGVPSLLPGP